MHRMNFGHTADHVPAIKTSNPFVSYPVAVLFILWMIGIALVHLAG